MVKTNRQESGGALASRLIALLAALALIAAACSSGESSTEDSGDTGASSDASASDEGTTEEEPESDESGAEETDEPSTEGTDESGDASAAGDEGPLGPMNVADGEPLVFGLINLESGPITFADLRLSAEVAANYINNHQGGINGRPIQIESCFSDNTPATSAQCAEQLLDADPVAFIGGFDGGSPGSVEVMRSANKAWIGGVGLTPVESNYENAVIFNNLIAGGNAGTPAYLIENFGVSSMGVIYSDDPPGQGAAAIVSGVLEARGIEATLVPVPPGAADVSAQVATAVAAGPDAIYTLSPSACVPIVIAIDSLGYDGIVGGIDPCSAPQAIEAAGEAMEGVYFASPVALRGEDAGLYFAALEAYATEPVTPTSPAAIGFASVMNLHAALDDQTDFSTESILSVFRDGSDNPNFMGVGYSCDGSAVPNATALCVGEVQILQITGGQVNVVEDWYNPFG